MDVWCKDITWTNADLLSIGLPGRISNEVSIQIQTFLVEKMHLKMLLAKILPFLSDLILLAMEAL